MTGWEYGIFTNLGDSPSEQRMIQWNKAANKSGEAGWELVTIYEGYTIFKRPVEPGLKDGFLIMKQCCECENAQWAVDDNV